MSDPGRTDFKKLPSPDSLMIADVAHDFSIRWVAVAK